MQGLPSGGAMVALQATEDEVRPLLTDDVGIAAVNGPSSVVVSGDEHAVTTIADQLRAQGRRVHQLTVSHAFHSPLMEPMLDAFRREAASVAFAEPRLPYETALGAGREWTDPGYWADQIRDAVLFAPMVDRLLYPPGSEAKELVGYGFYEETYAREDGAWKIKTLKLVRTRVDVTPF